MVANLTCNILAYRANMKEMEYCEYGPGLCDYKRTFVLRQNKLERPSLASILSII
jgi:hypothetical protein